MENIELLKNLIQIPSYGENNLQRENQLCDWLSNFCKRNLPEFTVERFVSKEGLNTLLVMGSKKPKIIFACHMDTVPPSTQDQTQLRLDGDKAFGLGTKDMKGGCVAALRAAQLCEKKENLGLLFYSDEEYSQKGIKEATKILLSKGIKPFLVVSPESRFNIGYGARGIIVAKIKVIGLRAHSSRPHLGKDAIKGLFKVVQMLEKEFGKTTELGKTTFTLGFINGGLLDKDQSIKAGASSIPDICEAILSVRNALPNLNGKVLADKVTEFANKLNLQAECSVTEDFPLRKVDKKFVQKLVKMTKKLTGIKLELGDPKLAGYNDAAILAQELGCPVINFGPYGEDNHTANEWVSVGSIGETARILAKWVENSKNKN